MRRLIYILMITAILPVLYAGAALGAAVHPSCGDCHTRGKALKAPTVVELCRSCHASHDATFDHQGVVPVKRVPQLRMDKEGRITCITCHEPHGKRTFGKLLRMKQQALCSACHPDQVAPGKGAM